MNRNEEGVALFEDMRRELPGHPLCEGAFYWQGMGHSFAGEDALSREHLAGYLERYPAGRYRPDSVFRRAFSIYSQADYATANTELRAYLEAYPGDGYNDEARLLLGDGLFAVGELDAGIASYRAIRPASTRFFEDGWFKVGKALKLQRQFGEMREHFAAFVENYSESRRMAEAVYQIGWAHKAEGDEAAAREIYWATIGAHGGRAELFGIADLFDGLRKLYPGDKRAGYRARLKSLAADARGAGDVTLELHAQWAAAGSWSPQSVDYRVCFTRAAELCDPEIHNPRIVADCADFLFGKGDHARAEPLYAGLRKWHPRAVERDRALLGRARIAKLDGRPEIALDLLAQFEEEAPYSPRLADARLLRAELLAAGGRGDEGLVVLTSLLEDKTLPSAAKAEALFRSAEILAAGGEGMKATAYFERVYVAYGKYRELVARSYLRRGELLVGLGRRVQAVEVYRELAGRDDLAGLPGPGEARKRLLEMGEGDDA